MIRMSAVVLALCAAGVCAAQTSMSATPTPTRHFRLTFVLTYPQGQQPSQSFVLDVPVAAGRPGLSSMNMTAGPAGQDEGAVQQSLQCTDVHESPTGLAAKVNFDMDRVMAPLPGSTESIHNHLAFNRQIDLVLGKSTQITEEMHRRPLGKGDAASPKTPPPAPQITVTAIAM